MPYARVLKRMRDAVRAGNYVVTVHQHNETVIEETRGRLERAGLAPTLSPGYLFYMLMDAVVDGYFPILDMIEEGIDPFHRGRANLFADHVQQAEGCFFGEDGREKRVRIFNSLAFHHSRQIAAQVSGLVGFHAASSSTATFMLPLERKINLAVRVFTVTINKHSRYP